MRYPVRNPRVTSSRVVFAATQGALAYASKSNGVTVWESAAQRTTVEIAGGDARSSDRSSAFMMKSFTSAEAEWVDLMCSLAKRDRTSYLRVLDEVRARIKEIHVRSRK